MNHQREKLKKIEIAGFRSLKNVSWEPDPLNVLIGANGSGKSNLLRGIELLRESAAGKLRDSILAEGGLRQLLWDHRADELVWRIDLAIEAPTLFNQSLSYILALRSSGFEGGFRVAREILSDYKYLESGKETEPLVLIKRDSSQTATWDSESRLLLPSPEPVEEEQTLLSLLTPFDPKRLWATPLLRTLGRFRVYNELVTNRGAAVREAAVTRVEKALSPDGQNLIPTLHTLYTSSRDFKKAVDSGMRAAFVDFEEIEFAPAADQRIQLRIRWKGLHNSVSAAELSDGTLRFLMLLTVLANPEAEALIAIDEPETGLHPRMFPIVAEFAASAAERSTVVLTTHSPEFLDAFPEDSVPSTTVTECTDGETRLSKLKPDDLERWLKEYSLGKLFKSGELEALS